MQVLTFRLGFSLATGLPPLSAAGLLQPLLGIAVVALTLKIPRLMGGGGAGGTIVSSLLGTAASAAVGTGVGVGVRGMMGVGARSAPRGLGDAVHQALAPFGQEPRSHTAPRRSIEPMIGSPDVGRWVLAACVLAAVALLVPIALATLGIGAILAVAGGASTHSQRGPAGVVGQDRTDQTTSVAGQQADLAVVGPVQSVVAAARGLVAGVGSPRAPEPVRASQLPLR